MSAVKMEAIVEELEKAAEAVGVKVSYENLDTDALGGGGLCKVKGEWRCIVSKRAHPGERATLLARALARFDTSALFLTPTARDLVEAHGKKIVPDTQPAMAADDTLGRTLETSEP